MDIRFLFSNMRKRREQSRRRRIEQRACEIFQIEEYDNGLWYVCNGIKFCPCNIISKSNEQCDIVALLNTVRKLWIERHSNKSE